MRPDDRLFQRAALGERVVFLHSGGVFGLFAKSDELAPLLG